MELREPSWRPRMYSFLLVPMRAGRIGEGVLEGLEGADWLDRIEGGEGRLLFARALEAAERWDEAARHYGRFRSAGPIATETAWAASREAQVAARAGLWVPMLGALEAAGRSSPALSKWTVLELARSSLEREDAEQTLRILPMIGGDPPSLSWRGISRRVPGCWPETRPTPGSATPSLPWGI